MYFETQLNKRNHIKYYFLLENGKSNKWVTAKQSNASMFEQRDPSSNPVWEDYLQIKFLIFFLNLHIHDTKLHCFVLKEQSGHIHLYSVLYS